MTDIINKKTISIIVPAHDEEGNLQATVDGIVEILSKRFSDYEILIFNDFSTDKTGKIADNLAAKNPKIKVFHNDKNMGLGYNFTKGVEIAEKDYIMLVPGDNAITSGSIAEICDAAGQADIVTLYTVNTWVRPFSRRVVSKAFTVIMNMITGLNLRYYNGPCLHKSSIVKPLPMTTTGFAYMASILARLIKSGHSYIEIGMYITEREYGGSKAFRMKNVLSVSKTLLKLLWKIRFKQQ